MNNKFANKMIGPAILSMYAETRHNDTIDILIPFVQYAIYKMYSLGDIISARDLCEYVKDEFFFNDLPEAVIQKIVLRLAKSGGYVIAKNKKYVYNRDLASEYEKFYKRKQLAERLIQDIIDALFEFVQNRRIKIKNKEEVRKLFFSFLNKYGLSAINTSSELTLDTIEDRYYKIIGKFIIEENNKKSPIFQKILELIKGNFVSKAIYFTYDNKNAFKEKMKDIILILDAPVMLKILGLKSKGENNAIRELLYLLPTRQVHLRYLWHNFDELLSIIRFYMHALTHGRRSSLSLEYFDEQNFSPGDVQIYYATIRQRLENLGIREYPFASGVIDCNINVKELTEFLKNKIQYNDKTKALENDVQSICAIKQIRENKHVDTIENCKAIFVTSNEKLAYYTKQFLEESRIGSVITDTELTILFWLKSGNLSTDVPCELLVANAYAAVEDVPDSFINAAIEKITKMKLPGGDEDFSALIYEDIYLRRELSNECEGDIDSLTEKSVKTIKERYDEKILGSSIADKAKMQAEINRLTAILKEQKEKEKEEIANKRQNALMKSKIISRRVTFVAKLILYLIFVGISVLGLVATIINGIKSKVSWWGIIILISGIIPFISIPFKKINWIKKVADKLAKQAEDATYSKHMVK